MDDRLAFEVLAAGVGGAAFLWIGMMILVEGDRRALVTWALALAVLGVACFYYGTLVRLLFPAWIRVRERAFWWYIPLSTVAWYVVAIYHTRRSFSHRRWRWPRAGLVVLTLWAGGLAALGSARPGLFLHPGGSIAGDTAGGRGTGLYLALIGQVQAALWAALAIFIRARYIYRRSRNALQSAYGLQSWFIPATFCAIVAAGAIAFDAWAAPAYTARADAALQVARWLGLLSAIGTAAFLVGAITTNRQLLGRPIRTRYLLLRGAVLVTVTGAFLLAELIFAPESGHRFELLAIPLIAPLFAVLFDWNQYRAYCRSVERFSRFVQDSIGGWPNFDPDTCRFQARRIFDGLVREIEAEACYLHVQPQAHDEPLVLNYNWTQPLRARASKLYDFRPVRVGGQQLGYIALRGPRGIAYSALELDLAESCAYSIAGLYLDSRQAQTLEALVVRRERERQEQNQRLQRVLHDQVCGDLDAILKATQLLPDTDPELIAEIREAARESMRRIRDLLRDGLADLYPPILLREGLIAALGADTLRAQSRHKHVESSLSTGGIDDKTLNIWLADDLKRTVYAAVDEAIRNAIKYAGGSAQHPVWVRVRLFYDDSGLTIEVRDNGVGFVPELASPEGDGMGLRYHHAALRMVGGLMVVESRLGKGTNVRLFLPASILRTADRAPGAARPPALIAHSGLEWAARVLETERHEGGRLLINGDLSDLTRPPLVMEAHYRSRFPDLPRVARQMAEIDEQRQRAFEAWLPRFPYKDLVDCARLRRYLATGATDEEAPGVGVELARAHVRHVIKLLHEHANYQLALSDQFFEANIAVKPGYAVLWEKHTEHDRLYDVIEGIRDTDPDTIAEFTRRFEHAWASIAEEFREKASVIAWLEAWLVEAETGRIDEVLQQAVEA